MSSRHCLPILLSIALLVGMASADEIHTAVQNRDAARVKWLLKEDPQRVNAKDGNNFTPLLWAVHFGHHDMVKLLLTHKADVNARWNNDSTPLHRVAMYVWNRSTSRVETADLLLQHGADVNARDSAGNTPRRHTARRSLSASCSFIRPTPRSRTVAARPPRIGPRDAANTARPRSSFSPTASKT